MTKPEEQRRRHRQIVAENGALVDLLLELYPASALPPAGASEGEVRGWLAERRLIERLVQLRQETSGVPKVLGG